jgi:hypothetical protein
MFFVALLASREPDNAGLSALDSGIDYSEGPIHFAARPFQISPMAAPDTLAARAYLLANWPALGVAIFAGSDLHLWLVWNVFPTWRQAWHLSLSWVSAGVFIVSSTAQWAVVGWLLGLRRSNLRAPNRPLQPTSGATSDTLE